LLLINFGSNEFAADFSAIMVCSQTYNLYYTKAFVQFIRSICAVLVFGCSSHFLLSSGGSADPYLIFFITLGVFSGFTWVQENNTKQCIYAAASLAWPHCESPVACLPGLCYCHG